MKLLLITFSFPPAGGVGVLRALSLAKYLPDQGIRVDVLTARNAPAVGKDISLLRQVPESVTVHRTWTLDLPFALRKTVKRLVSRGSAARKPSGLDSSPEKPASSSSIARITGPIRRLLANLLLPDPQIGWLPFALPAARRIIRHRNIDAVVVTVPPFSSAGLVTGLRRSFPSLPILLDFRDEWLTTTLHLVSFNSNERARAIAATTESQAVRDATAVITVTEAARTELIGRYPHEAGGKFLCIHNGYDTEPKGAAQTASAEARQAGAPLSFTYLGSVYGSTDPVNVIEAVHALSPDLRAALRLRFIGHIERESYRQALQSLGDTIELRGFVPQAEALRAIESTDWLLLITHDRINVAAKFYDYLAGGKPILAAVHPDGDVRKLLDQTGAGRWADIRDPAALATLFAEVLRDPHAADSLTPRPEEIARFHRRALSAKYAETLHSLVVPEPLS